MVPRSPADISFPESATIRQLMRDEIRALNERQRLLRAQGRTGSITIIILLLCILVNFAFFLFLKDDYLALFITASFYLYMVYFITLIIPLGAGTAQLPLHEIKKFFTTMYHSGVIPTTDRFMHIFLDIFFINSRTLFAGFLVIFSCDLLFSLIGYLYGFFSGMAVGVILFQSLSILTFYFCVWKFEPYSIQFHRDVREMKGKLVTKKYPRRVVSLMFGISALFLLFVILSTIILLPGITVKTLLTLTGLEDLGNPAILVGTLLASQYFIVRFFHGISSARMAEQFAQEKISRLQSAQGGGEEQRSPAHSPDALPPHSGDALRAAAGLFLELKIFQVELRTLGGAFPVYIVNPDFSVILDKEVLATITGFLQRAGSSETADR